MVRLSPVGGGGARKGQISVGQFTDPSGAQWHYKYS